MINILIEDAKKILESNGYTVTKETKLRSKQFDYQTYFNLHNTPKSKESLLSLVNSYYDKGVVDVAERYFIAYNICNLLNCKPEELIIITTGEDYDNFNKLSTKICTYDPPEWYMDYWIDNKLFTHEIDIYKKDNHMFLKYYTGKDDMFICSSKNNIFDPKMYL